MALSTNEELLRLYKAADPQGFDQFYRRNHDLLFRFLKARLGSTAEAEEALQETFLRIHKSILRYDPAQSALGWAFKIARNVAIDRLRRARLATLPLARADSIPTPDVATDEAQEQLAAALAKLSPEDRELIEQRFFAEAVYGELAARIGISEAGVRQRLARLLRKLRGQINIKGA